MHIKLRSAQFLCVAAVAMVASGTGVYAWHEQHRTPLLEMYVFALKSGRSMFIRTPGDQRILVDGGANSEVIRHITRIIPFYSRRIDALIITNTDSKNAAGLIDLIQRYSVRTVFIPAFTLESIGLASSTDQTYATFISTLDALGIEVRMLGAGDQVDLNTQKDISSSTTVRANILFPAPPETFQYSKASAPEILMNITYKNNSILFMGNASAKVQKFIASNSIAADVDALIASHSASPGTLAEELIDTARPNFLVYSKLEPKKSETKTKKGGSKPDSLASVLIENRFNLKEKGTVYIVSDGDSLQTKTPD